MRRSKLAVVLLSSGLLLAGCGSSSNPGGAGGAGAGGHAGGTSGSAGRGGGGGTTASAGTSGGGTTGAAGTGGAGGAAGTGGTTGTAGAGGTTGTAGASGTTGTAGAGGTTGTAGAGGGAGAAGRGGSGGTAGAAGSGGAAGAAGAGGAGTGGGTAGGAGGGTAGGAGGAAGAAGAAGGGAGNGGGGAGGALTTTQLRGQYLVSSVLSCGGCHTPQGGALLSGTDCFVKSGTTGCLSSANLTNDDTGIKNLTDQQLKDAFTKGMDPDEAGKFLFSNMPYYQFATLSDADASAIVAYLRTVPGVSHTVQAATAPFDVQPSAADWTAVDPANLPAASAATGPTNGKYLATLTCVTCHTVEATVTTGMPRHIDATKAFQGGKSVTATVNGTSKTVQTSNLTPDATGLMLWNATQIATAITTDKDRSATTICGMRALANMTVSDATDIATYLLGIPAVANAITMTCQ